VTAGSISLVSRLLAAAAVALALSPAPLGAGTLVAASTGDSPTQMDPQLFTFDNWAGYAAETNLSSPQDGSVTAVGGSWTVPAVTPSAGFSARPPTVSVWVGFDGLNVSGVTNDTVEQAGTESYVSADKAFYWAWYQMYPAGMVYAFPVSAGDSITARVQYLPDSSTPYQLSLTDSTSQESFTVSTTGAAMRASADWIVEAPTDYGRVVPLPTFGSATFTGAWATINSTTGAIADSDWQVAQLDMSHGSDAMSPTALTTVGSGASATSSFTVVQESPEPSTLAILGAAVAAMAAWRALHRLCTIVH
jgi:hypothetical protein